MFYHRCPHNGLLGHPNSAVLVSIGLVWPLALHQHLQRGSRLIFPPFVLLSQSWWALFMHILEKSTTPEVGSRGAAVS